VRTLAVLTFVLLRSTCPTYLAEDSRILLDSGRHDMAQVHPRAAPFWQQEIGKVDL
jgi:hypothetical protein